ncbi:hypothetical protein LUX32_25200 [Actinomadura madurae]|nr:hypothetical protein [Actinomadura madurae]MCP9980537.1 hypothetical protein [Actinomadura madurae]
MLKGEQSRTAPFTADGESLGEADQDEHDRGGDADRGIGRQQPDEGGADAHDEEGQHEHALASHPVPEVADERAADRSGDEADGEGRQRGEVAGQGRGAGEELRGEDERRREGVDEEVVPLDGRADQPGHGHAPGTGRPA